MIVLAQGIALEKAPQQSRWVKLLIAALSYISVRPNKKAMLATKAIRLKVLRRSKVFIPTSPRYDGWVFAAPPVSAPGWSTRRP
jgi:hypothetical protein